MTPEQLQAEADRLSQRAIEMGTTSGTFSQMLNDAIMERLNYNQDLISSREAAVEENLALPAILRAELAKGPILNPLDREAAIARRRQATGTRLGSILSALEARGTKLSDLIGRGTTAYTAQSDQARMLAQLAQERADRALAAQERARAAAAQAAQLAAMRNMYSPQSATDTYLPESVTAPSTTTNVTRFGGGSVTKPGGKLVTGLEEVGRMLGGSKGTSFADRSNALKSEVFRPTGGQTFGQRITQNLALLNPFSWWK